MTLIDTITYQYTYQKMVVNKSSSKHNLSSFSKYKTTNYSEALDFKNSMKAIQEEPNKV